MLEMNGDTYVIGGDNGSHYQSSIYQLSCSSGLCSWTTLDQQLKVGRMWPHLSTAVAWREKKFKHFVFNKYFCLVLGVLKSKISKKFGEGFLRKLDFKLFHYKAMVQPVSKITSL